MPFFGGPSPLTTGQTRRSTSALEKTQGIFPILWWSTYGTNGESGTFYFENQ
jgi:hypothetical protein